ncbi:putative selenate ABC transporter substrate-binding protein [Granulosicoccus antarcticus]|uniref:Phosphate-import protein PhnD n=1 Tax=Granulosicoccus antarcticus IMCC3135 TaxID=1192854 RepID=A0A2Z2P2E2_9GAMM|nr:putative selenate ABC transporter substrate-binding protein [Granulosicoccus antarcticus]ASJ74717.1 Phosphate-import protein PhnD [Granulosicoccus antarcticus IMCC3135]
MTRSTSVVVQRLCSAVSPGARSQRFTRFLACATLLTFSIIGGQSHADTQNTFRISAIPDEAPTELIRKFEPLADYLSQVLEMPVSFVPVTDYAAAVEALVSEQIDMAWLGGFTYVQAAQRSDGKVEPIVQRAEDERFQSVFITQTDSAIQSIADLKGVSFSFGSPSSTSGHLMPRHYLSSEGIDVDNDLSIAFSGAHDATAFSVAGGRVAAGALNIKVWEKLVEEGKVDTDKLRVFYTTPEYHDYNWTIRPALSSDIRGKLIDAFIALDPENESDRIILDLQRATRFVPTEASFYDGIKRAAIAAELLGSN